MATPSTLGSQEKARLEVEVGVLAAQPLGPRPQLGLVERVVEAHHRHPVADLGEETRRGGAHRLRRRVGRGQRRDGRPRVWRSSTTRRSYSASGISGASSAWYSSLWWTISARSSAARAAASGGTVAGGRGHGQAAMPAPTTASGSSAS